MQSLVMLSTISIRDYFVFNCMTSPLVLKYQLFVFQVRRVENYFIGLLILDSHKLTYVIILITFVCNFDC